MFLSLAICALVLSTSCSSDDSKDDANPEAETQEGFIKFKYNNTVYNFEPSFIASDNINLTGSTGNGDTYKRISLWTPLNITKGSHDIVHDLSKLTTTYQVSFDFMPEVNNADATSGTMNITTATDKIIEGTFNFSGTSGEKTFTVTEGSFRIVRF